MHCSSAWNIAREQCTSPKLQQVLRLSIGLQRRHVCSIYWTRRQVHNFIVTIAPKIYHQPQLFCFLLKIGGTIQFGRTTTTNWWTLMTLFTAVTILILFHERKKNWSTIHPLHLQANLTFLNFRWIYQISRAVYGFYFQRKTRFNCKKLHKKWRKQDAYYLGQKFPINIMRASNSGLKIFSEFVFDLL